MMNLITWYFSQYKPQHLQELGTEVYTGTIEELIKEKRQVCVIQGKRASTRFFSCVD